MVKMDEYHVHRVVVVERPSANDTSRLPKLLGLISISDVLAALASVPGMNAAESTPRTTTTAADEPQLWLPAATAATSPAKAASPGGSELSQLQQRRLEHLQLQREH